MLEISGALLLCGMLLLHELQEPPEPAEQRDELRPLHTFSISNSPSDSSVTLKISSPKRVHDKTNRIVLAGGGFKYGSMDSSLGFRE